MTTVPTRVHTIGYGQAGAGQTLERMARLVTSALREWPTRETAAAIARTVSFVDGTGQIVAIRQWGTDHWYFLRDARGVEQLHGVDLMLRKIATEGVFAGDCDDAAILLGALCGAIGCAVRFQAVSTVDNPDTFVHVWAEAIAPQGTGEWIELDITRPFQQMPVASFAKVFTYPVL